MKTHNSSILELNGNRARPSQILCGCCASVTLREIIVTVKRGKQRLMRVLMQLRRKILSPFDRILHLTQRFVGAPQGKTRHDIIPIDVMIAWDDVGLCGRQSCPTKEIIEKHCGQVVFRLLARKCDIASYQKSIIRRAGRVCREVIQKSTANLLVQVKLSNVIAIAKMDIGEMNERKHWRRI